MIEAEQKIPREPQISTENTDNQPQPPEKTRPSTIRRLTPQHKHKVQIGKGKKRMAPPKDETTNLEKSPPSRSGLGTHQIANSGSYNEQTLIRRTKNRRKRQSSTGKEETKLDWEGS
ncbi:unnamed protein product [Linum trigynum]|uniref:Uncharacterized protein n=1 Tax=Linum trigynum TaxID=586398 RepID=A0AAV2EP73_9ROSI